MTAISCSFLMESTESGTPIWLFRLPVVAKQWYFWDKTEKINSFVVVLPLDPVRPTMGIVKV